MTPAVDGMRTADFKKKHWKFHPLLAAVILPAAAFFVFAAWSTPYFYHTPGDWLQSWQKSMFSFVCHQQLFRSYSIQGVPLAVCSRCLGIYNGLFLGLAVFSNFPVFMNNFRHFVYRLFFMITFILIFDGFGNLFDFWNTTNLIRTIIGLGWGIVIGMLLISALLIPRHTKRGEIEYGTF